MCSKLAADLCVSGSFSALSLELKKSHSQRCLLFSLRQALSSLLQGSHYPITSFFVCFFFFFFFNSHTYSIWKFLGQELNLGYTTAAVPDPLTCCAKPGIEPTPPQRPELLLSDS